MMLVWLSSRARVIGLSVRCKHNSENYVYIERISCSPQRALYAREVRDRDE
jgi:hypothetical protein